MYYSFSGRGKIKAVCGDLGHCSLLFKSDPNAVYSPPNAVYWLQGSFQRSSLLPLLSFAASPPFKPGKNNVAQSEGGSGVLQSDEDEVEENGASALLSTVKRERMSMLVNSIKALPGRQGEQFDPILIFPGLECWLGFFKEKLGEEGQLKGKDGIYRRWFQKHVSCKDALDSNIQFSKLFQNLQIRSCTEGIAETVDSIMNQHVGFNRYCFLDLGCDLVKL